MGTNVPPRWRSLAFDSAVGVAAIVVVAHAALQWSPSELPSGWPLLLLAVPVVTLLARFPLVISRGSMGIEIGLDSAVLILLVLIAPRSTAILVWALATAVTQMSTSRSLQTRLFNTGLCTFAGWAAVQVVYAVGSVGTTSPRELAAIAAGAVVYFGVDFLLTAIAVAAMQGGRLRSMLWDRSLPLMVGCFAAVGVVGYLGGLVGRTAPWATPLVAAPFIAVVAAAAAFDRADKNRARIQALFDAAADAHAAGTVEQVTEAVVRQSARVVRSPDVQMRHEPPGAKEIGVRVKGAADDGRWLVASPRPSGDPYTDEDRRALEALAAVAGESLGRARAVAEITHLAGHDPLTGLANRALFSAAVKAAVSARGDGATVVLFCDLDGFKAVNDSLGHDAGDELLVTVGRRLAAAVRPGDLVARLGGDEFAVLTQNLPDLDEAQAMADRLVETIGRPIEVGGVRLSVGCSIGVAGVGPGSADDATALLRDSDLAMYASKAAGKNRATIFRPAMLDQRMQRVTLEQQLGAAVGTGELVLHYQPIVHLATNQVDGFEALVRWQHPTRGLLGPSEFIPLAEETGLINEVGLWVLEQAHEDVRRFADLAGRPLTLAVNVAGSQLADGRLEPAIERLLAVPSVHLILEITESTLITVLQDTPRLTALRQLGALVAVDDFGTGYSSLAYLRELPVDRLKLDRAFVVGVDTDDRAAGMALAITAMARTLGLVVIVEGIEEEGQLAAVRGMGCEFGQGYHLAVPMPVAAVPGFLESHQPYDQATSWVSQPR